MAADRQNLSFTLLLARLWSCMFVLLAGCSNGVDIADGGIVGGGSGSGDDLSFGGSNRKGDDDDDDDDHVDEDQGEPLDEDVEYPGFRFTGNGGATCNGGTGPTQSGFNSTMDGGIMTIQTTRAYMQCGNIDKCDEGKANEEISQSIATNTYSRVSDKQLEELEDAEGFTWGRYAVFASGVDHKKLNGNEPRQFTFSKPLPVFPFPAAASRFKPLETIKSWTATTSGSAVMTVTVTMLVLSSSESQVVVKMVTTIAEDRNRELYELFPLPRESTYTIDTQKKQIARIDVLNWFLGNKCDDRPEQVTMAYDVCEKNSKGVIENYRSCDQ
jgi:hypothetical protein